MLERIADGTVLLGDVVSAPRVKGDFAACADRFNPEAVQFDFEGLHCTVTNLRNR
jgi:hypothetical protein